MPHPPLLARRIEGLRCKGPLPPRLRPTAKQDEQNKSIKPFHKIHLLLFKDWFGGWRFLLQVAADINLARRVRIIGRLGGNNAFVLMNSMRLTRSKRTFMENGSAPSGGEVQVSLPLHPSKPIRWNRQNNFCGCTSKAIVDWATREENSPRPFSKCRHCRCE